MAWEIYIQEYENYLRLERGLSPHSVEAYVRDVEKLHRFLAFRKSSLQPISITVIELQDFVEFITLTYLDNEALDERIVAAIESKKSNARWWKVYGLGQLGEAEGRIYTNWKIIDEVPHEARLKKRGLDFGYKNDPSACIDVYEYNGGFVLDEVFYQTGMLNRQIADVLNNLDPNILVIADSVEPKSIDDIRERGILIQPAIKGKDSINAGVDYIQDQVIWVTKRSVNLIKEYRTYSYMQDRITGAFLNKPEDANNHAMDAIRYALYDKSATITPQDFSFALKPKKAIY